MSEFEREDRYLVFKRKDIEKYLTENDQSVLYGVSNIIRKGRFKDGRDFDMDCVVIESDWPEYEPAWEMIEDRVARESKSKQERLNGFNMGLNRRLKGYFFSQS
jgi:hypothetical protein